MESRNLTSEKVLECGGIVQLVLTFDDTRENVTVFEQHIKPNLDLLKEARFRQYDETAQLLSWNFSAFLDQPCAQPLKNATFFLIIGNETAENVQKVRLFATMISLVSFVMCR